MNPDSFLFVTRFSRHLRLICLVLFGAFSLSSAPLGNTDPVDSSLAQRDPLAPILYFFESGPSPGFVGFGLDYRVAFTPAAVQIVPSSTRRPENSNGDSQLIIRFKGANPRVSMRGADLNSGTLNIYQGADSSDWREGVPTYSRILYEDLYPDIQLAYFKSQKQLKSEFLVSPGGDPTQIRFSFEGASSVKVQKDGSLLTESKIGRLVEEAPFAYQMQGGKKIPVEAAFVLESAFTVRYEIGPYDPARELIIDPTIQYATYFGGSRYETAVKVDTDDAGNTYFTGYTDSPDFPVVGPSPPITAQNNEIYVTKLSPDGMTIIYTTILGGDGQDGANDIAVDSVGRATIVGGTNSSDFPVLGAL